MKKPNLKSVVLKAIKKAKYKSEPTFVPTVETAPQQEAIVSSLSPNEVDKKSDEPTLIRLSKKFGSIGGTTLGALLGSRVGFGKEGAEFGGKHGGRVAEFASRKLMEHFPILGSFKKGGRIPKTGAYLMHKGERVIPVKRRSRYK